MVVLRDAHQPADFGQESAGVLGHSAKTDGGEIVGEINFSITIEDVFGKDDEVFDADECGGIGLGVDGEK